MTIDLDPGVEALAAQKWAELENKMSDADGRTINKAYDAEGNLIAESKSPEYWWVFVRQEPLDYISKRVQGGKREKARVYISQGMEIVWA